MVTESKYPNEPRSLSGLSTDTKPTEAFDGLPITNGSTYLEIDTGYVYLYNAAADTWAKL